MSIAKIYALGGTGCNQVSGLTNLGDRTSIVYADTSDSDIIFNSDKIDQSKTYLFKAIGDVVEQTDGSGKRREKNFEIIAPQIPKFLEMHKPAKFNIVVCSDSGGSGPVIGHLLVEELLKQGKAVVLCLTNSVASYRSASNAVKALMGFNKLALGLGKSLPLVYTSNHLKGGNASASDAHIRNAIQGINQLFVRRYHSLDTEDIYNFLCPHIGAEHNGGLIELAYRSRDEVQLDGAPISILSLLPTLDDTITTYLSGDNEIDLACLYDAHGIEASLENPIHFFMITETIKAKVNFVAGHFKRLDNEMKSVKEAKEDDLFGDIGDIATNNKSGCFL